MGQAAIQVGQRLIGPGAPCFVIAEAGSNHNGSLEQALRLVDLAADSKADAVKFQIFRAEKLYPRSAGPSAYLKDQRSIYAIIQQMELPYEWLPRLADHCKGAGVLFMASVFDEESLERCDPFVQVHKIASYEMTHYPLIDRVARKGKPVVISTGAGQMKEVGERVERFRATGNRQLLLMQCTAAYPAPPEALSLRAIPLLSSAFHLPVGLSDHSRHPWLAPVAAVALGAALVEKHFTFSNTLPGPDHKFAVEPEELKEMIRLIRLTEQALGNGEKRVHPIEQELRDFARRSVFTSRAVGVGEILTEDCLVVLRNGQHPHGAEPGLLPSLIGRRATRDLKPEEPVGPKDFE